jgi:ABC-type dipeptide/oligopeptide/nickel transport system permease subunit
MAARRVSGLPATGRIGLAILAGLALVALAGPSLTADPYAQNLAHALEGPSGRHWLGTDQLGRDLLARIVLGSRLSLLIGLGATLFGLVIGGSLGVLAGYLGRWFEAIAMRAMEGLIVFPGILIALMVVTVAGPGVLNVVLAVGLRAVPIFARVAQTSTRSLCQQDFVVAAHALGAPGGRVLARHVLPSLVNSLLVVASLQVATAILIGATLSFLGVGVPPETPEWGAMLNAGRRYMLQQGQLVIYPGLAIMITILGINLFGDGLRLALDPRHTRGRLLG